MNSNTNTADTDTAEAKIRELEAELSRQQRAHDEMQAAYEAEIRAQTQTRDEITANYEAEIQVQTQAREEIEATLEAEIANLHSALKESKLQTQRAEASLQAFARLLLRDQAGQFRSIAFHSQEEARSWWNLQEEIYASRRDLEQKLLEKIRSSKGYTEIDAFCAVCAAPSRFRLNWNTGITTSNTWREQLQCEKCFLHSRQRAVLHFLDIETPPADTKIYLTEQTTVLYERISQSYEHTVGSEFLGESYAPGELNEDGIRHEDLTRLSFEDASFDLIASFDVLEHIPNYKAAIAECGRVLKADGRLILTVPFDAYREETLPRAALHENGEIEHFMEPEYHGDPLSEEGCLAFYLFGWDLLDELRKVGFERVEWHQYWSAENAYLGDFQYLLIADRGEVRFNPSGGRAQLRALSERLRQKIYILEDDCERYQKDVQESEERQDAMQQAYEEQLKTLEKEQQRLLTLTQEIPRVHEAHQEMQQSYEANISQLHQAHQEMKDSYEEEVTRLQQAHQEMQDAYEEEVARLTKILRSGEETSTATD